MVSASRPARRPPGPAARPCPACRAVSVRHGERVPVVAQQGDRHLAVVHGRGTLDLHRVAGLQRHDLGHQYFRTVGEIGEEGNFHEDGLREFFRTVEVRHPAAVMVDARGRHDLRRRPAALLTSLHHDPGRRNRVVVGGEERKRIFRHGLDRELARVGVRQAGADHREGVAHLPPMPRQQDRHVAFLGRHRPARQQRIADAGDLAETDDPLVPAFRYDEHAAVGDAAGGVFRHRRKDELRGRPGPSGCRRRSRRRTRTCRRRARLAVRRRRNRRR